MLNVVADAASMEIEAGVAIAAAGCAGKHKAKLLAIGGGGKHGMLALGAGGDRGDGLFSFVIRGEVTRGTTMKTAGVGPARMSPQRSLDASTGRMWGWGLGWAAAELRHELR